MHAIGASGRHVFWAAPARGPMRLVNPGIGIRRIAMGQAEPVPPQSNRLLNVRTNVILSRGALTVPAHGIPAAAFQAVSPETPLTRGNPPKQGNIGAEALRRAFPVPPSRWTPEERAALEETSATPTSEELADVALIDSYFGRQMNPALPVLICKGTAFRIDRTLSQKVPPFSTTPFNCTGAQPLSWGGAIAKPEEFFKLDSAEKWGDQQLVARNAETLLGALAAYPFPSPLSAGIRLWPRIAQDKLVEAARYKWPLDFQVARFLLTLIVLDTYVQTSSEIMDYFKDKAKRDKRYAIIKNIALSVVSLVFPAIISVGFSAVFTVLDAREAAESAKDMIKAAKQFEATDAEFSTEIKRAAAILGYQAAQEEGAAELTQEEAEATAEPGQEGEVTVDDVEATGAAEGGGIQTELLVGGGVATAVVIALAFLGMK